ncbi:MAG: FliG C-terminal domain-containing protein [Deltaproteobacteria bacterium]
MDFAFPDSTFAPAAGGGFPAAFPDPFPPTSGTTKALDRFQKAAVIIRLLLQSGIQLPLADLPDEAQDELIHNMTKIRTVDRNTVNQVVDEFLAELDTIGLLFPGSMGRALEALGSSLSPIVTSRARAKLGLGDTYDPWERLTEVDNETLSEALINEGPETAAIVLAKLKVSKVAEVLSSMPGREARRVAYAMSLTATAEPELIDDIGRALFDQLRVRPANASAKAPAEIIGAILNSSRTGTRDEVLSGLDEDDKTLADEVRKSIFTFVNIPTRIDARDVPKFLRNVDQKMLLIAIAGRAQITGDTVAPFILGNMSSRLAQQIKDDMEGLGKLKPKEIEEAENSIVTAIRDMADAGEIVFKADQEEEEDA